MEYLPLSQLIDALEIGASLHISVAFFVPNKTSLLRLPRARVIHSTPFCTEVKKDGANFAVCYQTREKKFRRAKEEKAPFTFVCPCGITEYLHPVSSESAVICLIMISTLEPKENVSSFLTAAKTKAAVIENHILHLLENAPRENSASDPLTDHISDLLVENLPERFSLKELAASLGYHEKYLGALFKKKTGKSAHAYLNEQRLLRAEALLRNTHLSVIEIATRVGFDNVSYFNRLFRKKNQVSPGEYRKRNRK